MRKLKYEDVYKVFKENGCELLEDSYKNNSTDMKFKCTCGNIDYKSYARFKKHPRCRRCCEKNSKKQLRRKKHTYEDVKEFVESNSNCKLVSLEYKNNSTPLIFLCDCGEEFTTTFAKFKDRGKRQCNKCSKKRQSKHFSFTIDYVKSFVNDNSDCVLISDEYINNSEPLDFICKCGNPFSTSFAKFKDRNKRQCYDCGIGIRADSQKFDINQVKNIIELEDCKLLSKEYINARTPIYIECECGDEFYTTLEIFQRGKNRCDYCTSKQSKLERLIENHLTKCQIKYEKEYRFSDCRKNKPLPFDFAVFDKHNNLIALIEADGVQHFKPVEYFGGETIFLEQKERDKIKDEYCLRNNITLIRIPYYKEEDIPNILDEYFSTIIPSQA